MRLKTLIFALTVISETVYTQVPDKFKYSTEIKQDDKLVKSKEIQLQISLLKDSVKGDIIYKEKQTIITNENGIANFVIGDENSKKLKGSLSDIDWANNLYFIKIAADINDDGKIDNSWTSQVLSVPYALYAKSAGEISSELPEKDPDFKKSVASSISQNDTNNWNDLVRKHKHFIGELYGGGIVYWVTPDGQHGLVASLNDLCGGKKVQWSPNPQRSISGAQSYTDGKSNSAAIIKADNANGYPAEACSAYKNGIYNDWYLPSNQELQLMLASTFIIDKVLSEDNNTNTNGVTFINKVGEYGRYWSSTEQATNAAWLAFFTQNRLDFDRKDTYARVRAIRSF